MKSSRTNVLEEQAAALENSWDCFRLPEIDSTRPLQRSQVFKTTYSVNGRAVPCYVKIYGYYAHFLQRILRAGRSFNECRNLLFFGSLNIPSAKVLAWGQKRNFLGRITQDYIITESVEGAVPLDDYVREHGMTELQAARIAKTLGGWLRKLHANNFYHKDIHWRNVLIRHDGTRHILTLIDCPRGDFHTFATSASHWRLKDSAMLDKYASVLSTTTARAVFLKTYLSDDLGSTRFQEWAKRIENYRINRFEQRRGRNSVKPLPPEA